MRSPVCASSLSWSGDVTALSRSLVGFHVGWRCILLQKDPDQAVYARSSPSDDQVRGRCDRMKRYGFGSPDQQWSEDIYTCVDEFIVRGPRALFASRPVASALSCCQPLAARVRGIVGQSAYYVCPTVSPTACCQGSGALFDGWPGTSALPCRSSPVVKCGS
ncbi:hypothetical protein BHE74_00042398 [Ensete ventricosum]|nr:hypothetical protein BHE74_00042398 [Ensete ventricosum]